jgi:hypothetical protein
MRRKVALCGVVAVIMAGPAGATSWREAPDHELGYAICETRKLADYVNSTWAEINERDEGEDRFVTWDNFDIYTNKYGKIGSLTSQEHGSKALPSHQFDFVEDLRMSFGKEDQGPITAYRLVRLVKDKKQPVYVVQLRRTRWTEILLLPDFRSWEGYGTFDSTWIISFTGNDIEQIREADELAPFATTGRDLLATRLPDCKRLERQREED